MGWRGFGPWRQELRAFLELFALCGVAVAQPAFDLLSNNATLFVTLRSTKVEVVELTLLLVLVPPVVLWAVEVVAGLVVPPARRWVHAALAALVAAVIVVEVLKHGTDLGSRVMLILAAVLAVVAGVLVLRFAVVRTWLRYLAIAPVVFALIFLFASPVTGAVFDGGPPVATAKVGRPTRIVMIVLDELALESLLDGSGHIDAVAFPHLAALAHDATWYRNSTTVAPNTEVAVPAILTGDYPTDPDALPVAQKYPHNLFTLLGGGYRVNAHETVTQLCPRSMCGTNTRTLTRYGLEPLVHDTLDLWRDFASPSDEPPPVTYDASSVSGAATPVGASFVRSLKAGTGPRLDFLHILLPHQPWHLRTGGYDDAMRGGTRGQFGGTWVTEGSALSARQRHRLQLQATDDLVGRITAKLKRLGAYDDSLIVLTADHGVAFTAGQPERGVSDLNWPQILWTPLLIKTPGQAGGRIDERPAESIDVLPTIADLVDIHPPWKVDGRSLLDPPVRDGPRRIFEWKGNRAQPPAGQKFLSYDGPSGYSTVVRSGAPTMPNDPFALYRMGPFGGLVGRAAAPLTDNSAPPPRGFVAHREHFEHVRTHARRIPWAYVQGRLFSTAGNQTVAVTVNGVVAGIASTVGSPYRPGSTFWATLAPQTFHDGTNVVVVNVVSGTPSAPRLVPVRTNR